MRCKTIISPSGFVVAFVQVAPAVGLPYERMFDTVPFMRFEVDVVVQHPLDQHAERFLTSVQRSANRVLRFRGDDKRIVVTIEAHAYNREGAIRAAIQEVAHIYPTMKFQATGEPRPL